MKTDIEIAHEIELLPIAEVAQKLGINEQYVEYYGTKKAKISLDIMSSLETKKEGKLILVTSTNPTPFGEGKTTMSIGLHDAFRKLGENSLVVLREPSLGPVFGIKGGATGGGYAQVVPMEEINLHFTGDMHAITACNNLLCAAIDNHLFQGNELNLDPNQILFPRCMDMNDRSLREIQIGIGEKNGIERVDHFVITVATEIMAILCLATDLMDLKKRLSQIHIGYTKEKKPVYVSDLQCEGAMTILLKDAIKPNLVQTLEGNPAIIHGGPFANIAHGCNSIIATKMGLKLSDYVITEAGFGADLGAEKFLDIKCRFGNLKPDAIVINTTIRSLKYNGGASKEELKDPNIDSLKAGIGNLKRHIENMKLYSNHVLVCINQFGFDTEEELAYVKAYCQELGVSVSCSTSFRDGGSGSVELAKEVIKMLETDSTFHVLYDDTQSILEKIEVVAQKIYRADGVLLSEKAQMRLQEIEKLGYQNFPICIAKTQYSFSDDPKKLGAPTGFKVTVRDLKVCSGAGFIVVYMGDIMTMPGLSKTAAYLNMDIDEKGNITGLF